MFRYNWALIIAKAFENISMSVNYVIVITTPDTIIEDFWVFTLIQIVVSFCADSLILFLINHYSKPIVETNPFE